MSAIKVVQIAITMSSSLDGSTDQYAEYLDDKGRVWYQEQKWVYPEGSTRREDRKLETEWKQVELPEEPAA